MIGSPRLARIGMYDGEGRWIPWLPPCASPCPFARGSASCSPSPFAAPAGTGTSFPDLSSTYFLCQKSSSACTMGISSKLCSGGGDEVIHSIVRASHGSLPAISPCLRECTALYMKSRIEAAIVNEPIVDTMFQKSQPIFGAYV